MTTGGGSLSDEEVLRNSSSFTFFQYKYERAMKEMAMEGNLQKKPLKSTLT